MKIVSFENLSENEFPRNLICSRAAATCLRQKMMKNCSQKHLQLGKKVSKIPSTSSRKEENLKRKNNYFKRGKKMWLKFSQIK